MNCRKISIIVPVYNVQDCLGECLDSLLDQTYENLEIIVVNDGSTDDSPAIAEDYWRRDGRISLIHQENKGLSSARNVGLGRATGDYVMFVDSDDSIDRETCRELAGTINDAYADLVVFGLKYLSGGRIRKRKLPSVAGRIEGKEYLLEAMGRGEFTPTVCNKCIRVNLAQNITFPVGVRHEDIYYTIIALLKSKAVASIDTANYIYRKDRCGSITSDISLHRVDDIFVVYKLLFEEMTELHTEILQSNIFLDNAVERVNIEILMKLVDGTPVKDRQGIVRRVCGEEWFAGLAKKYILRGKMLNHRLLLALFFYQPCLFRVLGKIYFDLKRGGRDTACLIRG